MYIATFILYPAVPTLDFQYEKKCFFCFPCQSVCEVSLGRHTDSNHARTSKLERKILEI
jgi:hypothetical protein